jgi:hypothetical protein
MLGAKDFIRVYNLQRSIPELAVMADSFHIKLLLRIQQSVDRFQIFAVNRHPIGLFELILRLRFRLWSGRIWVRALTLLLVQTFLGVLDQTGQSGRGAVDSQIQARCTMYDRDGLVALEAGFQQAAHVVVPALLVAVFIAQMDVQQRDPLAQPAQGIFQPIADFSLQVFVNLDVAVGVDLNPHGFLLVAAQKIRAALFMLGQPFCLPNVKVSMWPVCKCR